MLNLLLLLLCFDNYSETTSKSVTEKKGGNVTLPCGLKDSENYVIRLFHQRKNIPVCQTEECSGRVFKKENCDVVMKHLRLNDAGKYILRVNYNNDQTELEYQLRINDEITVKIDDELKLDVLLTNTDKVEHHTNIRTECKEVWSRSKGVQSDRLSVSDGNLTINNCTVNDEGSYIVMDSKGEILITVTVKVSSTEPGLQGNMTNTQSPGDDWRLVFLNSTLWRAGLYVVLAVSGILFLSLIIFAVIKIYQHLNRNEVRDVYQGVPMQ